MATSISTSAGALATGLLQAANASPYALRTYYTCTRQADGEKPEWLCSKGFNLNPNSRTVDICRFQPDIWHRGSVAKCLNVEKSQVEIRD
jgi:hypothetical protein